MPVGPPELPERMAGRHQKGHVSSLGSPLADALALRHGHERDHEAQRGRAIGVRLCGGLVQHATGEARGGQMRMDPGRAKRQARKGSMTFLALVPYELRQRGQLPGALVRWRPGQGQDSLMAVAGGSDV
jgi:hypothetical protein